MNENCTIVILGVTGDLAKLKLIPAVYELFKSKKIGKFALVGTASSERDANAILEDAKKNIPEIDENIWNTIKNAFLYCQGQF